MKKIKLLKGGVAIIDSEDYEKISDYKWTINSRGYVVRWSRENGKQKCTYLHKVIMDSNKHVDHKYGNKLDNRKISLRYCTSQQNNFNKPKTNFKSISEYKGVSFCRGYNKKWKARIYLNDKEIYGGHFYTEKEAALKYNELAKIYHGGFACLNKI